MAIQPKILSTDPFDDLFLETHGGVNQATWEMSEDDEVTSDDYSENEDLT